MSYRLGVGGGEEKQKYDTLWQGVKGGLFGLVWLVWFGRFSLVF